MPRVQYSLTQEQEGF